MKIFNKKYGQSFSTDIIIVSVIILFGVLFLVLAKINDVDSTNDLDNFEKKSEIVNRAIVNELKKSEVIDENNNLKIEELLQLDTNELKDNLNLPDDFCIVFEKDGHLVQIDSKNNINGIGSSSIIVNGVGCRPN